MNASDRKKVPAAMTIALVMLLASCFLLIRPFDEEKWREQLESADLSLLYAPHLKDGRYFNRWMNKPKPWGKQ
jgi:N-acyl-phosphatidylethanolamine-hydrolysing phospholipase D